MVKSGLIYPFGMGFWGPNGHDGIWHISLINHLSQGSFEMPIFAGEQIKNYHLGFDLILAGIHKLTSIPASILYFQIIPPILALIIGWLTYQFVKMWRKSSSQAFWATFFVYFAGDFGWILTLMRGDGFGGESLFWSQQAVSTLVNPPFAMSLVLFLLGLIFLVKTQKSSTIHNSLLIILVFGLLTPIKVYAGILALGGLLAVLLTSLHNGLTKYGVIFLGSAILSFLFLLPTTGNAKGLVVFQPFWFLETMMAVSDRVGWTRFYEAMMNYKTGGLFVKLIPAYLVAFMIFFIGNMGTRIIGLIGIWRDGIWKRFSEIDIFLLTVALLGIILPMFILQSGTPWNTIQFFYYSLFVFALYTGVWVGEQMEHSNTLVYWGVGVIVFLSVPTTISTLALSYIPGRPPAKISHGELGALKFLNDQPKGVVLTYPFDRYKAELAINSPPRSLYLYESSAYVSAFGGKPVFIEDEVNLDITGFNWRERREKSLMLFDTLDQAQARQVLEENKIKYLYLVLSQSPVVDQRFRLGESQLGLSNIFENQEVVIYKVD